MKASAEAGSLGGSKLNPKGTRWESVGTSWSTGGDEVTSGADCTVVSGTRRHFIGSRTERADDAGTPAGDMSGVVPAPETTMGVTSQQCANPKQTDDASALAKDLLGITLVPETTMQSAPDVTSSPPVDQ